VHRRHLVDAAGEARAGGAQLLVRDVHLAAFDHRALAVAADGRDTQLERREIALVRRPG